MTSTASEINTPDYLAKAKAEMTASINAMLDAIAKTVETITQDGIEAAKRAAATAHLGALSAHRYHVEMLESRFPESSASEVVKKINLAQLSITHDELEAIEAMSEAPL